jgi:hypothetical protein
MKDKEMFVMGPRWWPDTRTDRLTVGCKITEFDLTMLAECQICDNIVATTMNCIPDLSSDKAPPTSTNPELSKHNLKKNGCWFQMDA